MNYQNNVPSSEQSGAPSIPSETYPGHYHVHQSSNIPINIINNNNTPESDPNGNNLDRHDKRLFFITVVEILTVSTITAATTTEPKAMMIMLVNLVALYDIQIKVVPLLK
ncbi:4458_t:CDS:2 [Entrophospora sp. SA101]|nr:4458_t:CDS:2 [Entrophospora sp. SA101]